MVKGSLDWSSNYKPYWYYWVTPGNPWTSLTTEVSMNHKFEMTDKEYVFSLDLPGSTDVKVTRPKQDELVLQGTRKGHTSSRTFLLPEDAVFGEGKATYKDGVLVVTVPRRKLEPQSIPVQF